MPDDTVLLERHFDTAFAAPDGIQKLRELILSLAMQGKLVLQDPKDQPASELLKEIETEKQKLVKEGKIKQPKPLPDLKPEDVPYKLPEGWNWVRLGSVSIYIQRGIGPSYSDTPEIPVISQKCIQWSGFKKNAVRFIDPGTIDKYRDERFIKSGDLLWNSTGTGTIGRINIYRDELDEFKKVVADSHVTVVRLAGLCNEYVLNFLTNPSVQSHIEENASGTTNQIELNTTTVINQIFPLPPLAEQRRIVAKIDRLMARCDELEKLRAERNQKRITIHTAALDRLLNAKESDNFSTAWRFITQHFGELYLVKENVAELRKAILQLAVMGKLVPQDPTDEPASELLRAIAAEKQQLVKEGKIKQPKPLPEIKPEKVPYELPKGWEWVLFGDVANSRLGKMLDKSKNRGIPRPYLRNTNVQWHWFELSDIKQMKFEDEELDEFRVMPGDLLICEGGEPGRCAIWSDPSQEIYFQKALHRARPYSGVAGEYLQICLTIDAKTERLNRYFTGAIIRHFPGDKLSKYVVPLPPNSEQQRIVAKIDQLMSLCNHLDQQIDAAMSKQADLLNALMAHV